MKRFAIAVAFSVLMPVITSMDLHARNQRIPPPPVLISGGGLPDGGDPWSLDDPFGGEGGSGGGLDDNRDYGYPSSGPPIKDGDRDTHGDGGWEWWNNADFWGWGSGWWRYPDTDLSDADGEIGGNGGDDHDHALAGCRIIVTGGEDNRCDCFIHVLRDETGRIVWTDTKTYCAVDPVAVNPGCREKNPGEPCR